MFKFRFAARAVPLLLLPMLLGGATLAKAQGVSAYFGFGAATDSSNGQELECNSTVNPLTCGSPGVPFPDKGPKMTGSFGTFGADFMWKKHLGFGGEYSWRLRQGPFAPQAFPVPVTYRPSFYDFNVIWHPISVVRVVPEIQGGIGGENTKFYQTVSGCLLNGTGCATVSQYATSSNFFQLHFSGGVRFYVKGSLYLRPQVDVHWVNGFNEFGSGLVPEYSVVFGYTLGGR
jgi:hypothetical protein